MLVNHLFSWKFIDLAKKKKVSLTYLLNNAIFEHLRNVEKDDKNAAVYHAQTYSVAPSFSF